MPAIPPFRPITLAALALAGLTAAAPAAPAFASATAGDESRPARSKAAATAAPAPRDDAAAIEKLRERLAERLCATRPPDAPNRNVMRVVSRAEAEPSGPAAAAIDRPPPSRRNPPPAPAPGTTPAAKAAPAAAAGAGAAAALHAATAATGDGDRPHWAYSGETGPQAWGGLRPEFATCAKGTRQSPIDIRGGIAVDLEPVLFDYRAAPFSVIDNGHTVQVNLTGGNAIEVRGRRYELVQFHFHRPSEERINGRQFEMSLHLVHRDPEGRLAVVGLLLERGDAAPVVQQVWNNLPLEKFDEVPGRGAIDLNRLLPPDRRYYTYMGSLTTPPCTEGVTWIVMQQPVPVAPEQIDIFARLYPMNARPVQAASGRLIKQSQ